MDQEKSHILHIDSNNRSSGTHEDFIVHLNESEMHESTHVSLKEVTFANTMYNIRNDNNQLNWIDSLANSYNLTIPTGYYTADQLVTYINNETKTNATYANSPIQFANNPRKGKFNILNSYLVSAVTFYLLPSSTILNVIGFVSPVQTLALSHEGGQPYNMLATKYVHVISSKLAENDAMISSNGKKYAVIASVSVDTPFGFLISKSEEKDSKDESLHNSNVNLSTIDIRLVDDNFRTIDLNGSNVVITFTVSRH